MEGEIEGEIDCFGRYRTHAEVKIRNQYRIDVLCYSIIILVSVSFLIFFPIMIFTLPIFGEKVTDLFIIAATISGIIGIPLLFFCLLFILSMLYQCCLYELI